jgi:hypothetical protein
LNFPFTSFVRVLPLGLLALGLGGAGCSSSSDSTAALESDDAGVFEDVAANDTGRADASGGAGGDASQACVPGDVSDLKPQWKRAAPFYQDACSGAQVELYLASCLGAGDHTACASIPFKCTECIATPDTADKYGPLIVHSGWVELNVPGCLANAMNDPTGIKCAASVQAVRTCELQACGPNCPVTSNTTLDAFRACATLVDDGQCKTFVADAMCLEQLPADAGPELTICMTGTSFAERYRAIVPLFCVAPDADAGAGGG